MFSNIWYTAGVIDLQLGHLDEAQKRGNHYVHADCFLKPENMANYLPKNKMGLGIVHVRTKALALFIKNLLSEAKSDVNCYMSAVVEHYCCNVNLEPIPVRPPYLTDKLIQLMNLVLRQCDRLETKNIFHLLLKYEFKLDEDWKLRVVQNNPNLNFDNAVHLINSKILTITVRGSLWKHFHDVHYDDILRGKIKNSVPVCKLCNDVDINKKHLFFSCGHLNGIGEMIMKVVFKSYSEDDVLNFEVNDEEFQLGWFAAHFLHFMRCNRERCSKEKFQQYLEMEVEVLKRTQHCDTKFVENLSKMIDLLGATDH